MLTQRNTKAASSSISIYLVCTPFQKNLIVSIIIYNLFLPLQGMAEGDEPAVTDAPPPSSAPPSHTAAPPPRSTSVDSTVQKDLLEAMKPDDSPPRQTTHPAPHSAQKAPTSVDPELEQDLREAMEPDDLPPRQTTQPAPHSAQKAPAADASQRSILGATAAFCTATSRAIAEAPGQARELAKGITQRAIKGPIDEIASTVADAIHGNMNTMIIDMTAERSEYKEGRFPEFAKKILSQLGDSQDSNGAHFSFLKQMEQDLIHLPAPVRKAVQEKLEADIAHRVIQNLQSTNHKKVIKNLLLQSAGFSESDIEAIERDDEVQLQSTQLVAKRAAEEAAEAQHMPTATPMLEKLLTGLTHLKDRGSAPDLQMPGLTRKDGLILNTELQAFEDPTAHSSLRDAADYYYSTIQARMNDKIGNLILKGVTATIESKTKKTVAPLAKQGLESLTADAPWVVKTGVKAVMWAVDAADVNKRLIGKLTGVTGGYFSSFFQRKAAAAAALPCSCRSVVGICDPHISPPTAALTLAGSLDPAITFMLDDESVSAEVNSYSFVNLKKEPDWDEKEHQLEMWGHRMAMKMAHQKPTHDQTDDADSTLLYGKMRGFGDDFQAALKDHAAIFDPHLLTKNPFHQGGMHTVAKKGSVIIEKLKKAVEASKHYLAALHAKFPPSKDVTPSLMPDFISQQLAVAHQIVRDSQQTCKKLDAQFKALVQGATDPKSRIRSVAQDQAAQVEHLRQESRQIEEQCSQIFHE